MLVYQRHKINRLLPIMVPPKTKNITQNPPKSRENYSKICRSENSIYMGTPRYPCWISNSRFLFVSWFFRTHAWSHRLPWLPFFLTSFFLKSCSAKSSDLLFLDSIRDPKKDNNKYKWLHKRLDIKLFTFQRVKMKRFLLRSISFTCNMECFLLSRKELNQSLEILRY